MNLGVQHIGISTADVERLCQFYCTYFGMKQVWQAEWEDQPEMDAVVGLAHSAAKVRLLLGGNFAFEIFQYINPSSVVRETDRPVNVPGITHICFTVNDLDAEYERLNASGVRFHGPPMPRDQVSPEMGMRAVYGRDPDGNVFELLEFVGETVFDYLRASTVET